MTVSDIESLKDEWAKKICGYINERFEKKHEDLLSRKEKKPDDDPKQAILIQLKYVLSKNGVDQELIDEIVGRKNSGENKTSPLLFKEKQCKDLMCLGHGISNVSTVRNYYEERLNSLAKTHDPRSWLDDVTPKADGVTFSTHVPKITHANIKGVPSFFIKHCNSRFDQISTSSLKQAPVDSAITNAALSPIASLLRLRVNNIELKDYIKNNDSTPFKNIEKQEGQADFWTKNLSQVFESKFNGSHSLLKQIYFPYLNNGETSYHLLCNIKSSSMAHYLYEYINSVKDGSGSADFPRKKVSFPKVNSLFVTSGMKAHTNVSPLNKERRGEIKLLSAEPPDWITRFKPPTHQKSWFYKGIPYSTIQNDIEFLRRFLLRNEKLALSTRNPEKRKWLIRWGQSLTDTVLFYAQQIQALPPGWSASDDVNLKVSQQYFLDPFRDDGSFREARKASDWQSDVSKDFASWLNDKLKGKDKLFTPQREHSRLWELLMKNALRELSPIFDMGDEVDHKEEKA